MSVLQLADAKKHLNIDAADQVNDAELQSVINAAEAAIVERCGPLTPQSITRRINGGGQLTLPITPVISLGDVIPIGATDALDPSLVVLDLETGIVWGPTSSATFSASSYTVTYVAGRNSVPDDLMMAIKQLVKHLWRPQRGPTGRRGSQQGQSEEQRSPGYLIPNSVAELIAAHEQVAFA